MHQQSSNPPKQRPPNVPKQWTIAAGSRQTSDLRSQRRRKSINESIKSITKPSNSPTNQQVDAIPWATRNVNLDQPRSTSIKLDHPLESHGFFNTTRITPTNPWVHDTSGHARWNDIDQRIHPCHQLRLGIVLRPMQAGDLSVADARWRWFS